MFTTILAATDGSANGTDAIELAVTMARELHARLVLVHVTEYIVGKGGNYPRALDDDEVRQGLRARASELSAAGLPTSVVLRETTLGGPARVIAAVARDEGAGLLVTGSHGHTSLAQVVLGSVSSALVHLAPCPILVVPSHLTRAPHDDVAAQTTSV